MSYEEIHQPAAWDHPDDGHPSNEEDISHNELELRVRNTAVTHAFKIKKQGELIRQSFRTAENQGTNCNTRKNIFCS